MTPMRILIVEDERRLFSSTNSAWPWHGRWRPASRGAVVENSWMRPAAAVSERVRERDGEPVRERTHLRPCLARVSARGATAFPHLHRAGVIAQTP
jgi:hypothetical protein